MAGDTHANENWDRVASQLRAYREAQQRAWGEIDNATLGRFLADDVSGAERQQIEHELEERPELRKLTDLVREVLADFEPMVERPTAPLLPLAAPRFLPFPRKQAVRPSVVRWVQKRSAVLAAACLLLALSAGLLNSRVVSALVGTDRSVVASAPVGSRADFSAVAMARTGAQPFFVSAEKPLETVPSTREPSFTGAYAYAAAAPGLNRLELLNQKIDGLQEQGKLTEALDLSDKAANVAKRANLEQHPVYAVTQERKATILQQQGELDRACRSLSQAYNIRKQELGPQDKETAKTANSLADMYAVALNTGNRVSTNSFVLSRMVPGTAAEAKDKVKNEDQRRAENEHKSTAELRDRLHRQAPAALKREVVPVLLEGLRNAATEEERRQMVMALGNLGPNAAEATPVMVAALKSDSPSVRRCAAHALLQVHRDLIGLIAGSPASQLAD